VLSHFRDDRIILHASTLHQLFRRAQHRSRPAHPPTHLFDPAANPRVGEVAYVPCKKIVHAIGGRDRDMQCVGG
jgi:hypothetical protein